MASHAIKSLLMATAIGLPAVWAATQPATVFGQTAAVDDKDSVVVTGKHRVKSAADLQMDSVNTTTVITTEDLKRAPDLNVAEALSRVSGVIVLNGGYGNSNGVGVDEAGRGQGNFTAVRGMDSEFNINLINGVEAAQGRPYSREVQLDLLPPTGLQTIVVNKTLSAAMDGDAIGGMIDFRTPTAYDFVGKTHASLTVGGQLNDRALDYDRNGLGGSIAGDLAGKFGDHDQFGVYASAYYDKKNFSNSIVDGIYPAQTNGMYAYALQTASGASAPGLNPAQNLVLTGVDAGLTTGDTERYGGNFSVDWRPRDDLSGYMRLTYAKTKVEQDSYYSQIYGNNISSAEIGTTGLYQPVIGNIQPRYYYETNPEDAMLGTFQVGGAAKFGRLHIAPNAFVSYGENNEPNHFEISARLPEVAAGFPFGGSSLFTTSDKGPIPILTSAELTQVGDIGAYGARRAGELTQEYSNQTRYGGKLDATYDVDNGALKTISAGVKYEDSDRNHTLRDYSTNKLFTTDANDPTFASLGFLDGSVKSIVPGAFYFPAPLVNAKQALQVFNAAIASQFGSLAAASDECSSLYINTHNCDTQRGSEAVTSVYLMADLQFGQLEVIPGFRYEHSDIDNTFWVIPEDASGNEEPGYFSKSHTTYDKPLPSIQLNYRPGDLTVYRASIWTSYVRPSMFQLGGGEQISVGDGTRSITLGNPKLKAIDAVNFDASGEWANRIGSSANVAVFYKALTHFTFSSVNGFTNAGSASTAADGVTTTISQPENGGAGHVYGLELTGRQLFQAMPAPFDGFGVAGNLTLERSSVNTKVVGLDKNERLLDQPDLSSNLQAFYQKGPYQVDLSYRYIGAYVAQYGTLGANSALDTWVRDNERVDLHLGYVTPVGVHVDFSIANLLDADSYVASIGKKNMIIPSYVNSGRTYVFQMSFAY